MVNRYEAEEDFYGTPADWADLESVMPSIDGETIDEIHNMVEVERDLYTEGRVRQFIVSVDDVNNMHQNEFWNKVDRVVAETGRDECDVIEMLDRSHEYDY